jgi:hypothetical protein
MSENEICIYCSENTSNTIGIEHVIPESLGFKETLPKGYVCDNCNNYFANLDNVIVHNRFIALQVGTEQIPGKKDKIRKEIGNKLSFSEKGYFSLTSDTLNIPSGKLEESYEFKFSQDKVFNEMKFARGIHKIAFNLYAFNYGQRASLNQKFDNLRRYIKNPYKKEFWKYAVKYSPNSNNRFIKKNIVVFNIYNIEFMVSLVNDLDEKIAINNGYKILYTDNEWNHNSLFGLKDE